MRKICISEISSETVSVNHTFVSGSRSGLSSYWGFFVLFLLFSWGISVPKMSQSFQRNPQYPTGRKQTDVKTSKDETQHPVHEVAEAQVRSLLLFSSFRQPLRQLIKVSIIN